MLAGIGGGGVRVWDIASGKQFGVTDETHESPVHQIAAVGNLVATASGDKSIRLWDAAMGRQRVTLWDEVQSMVCIALSPDGTHPASTRW